MEKTMYTKHDLSQTDTFEKVDVECIKYKRTFMNLLSQIAEDVLENSDTKEELMFYMEQYYYSDKHLQSDCLPIDHLYDEWDPEREHYKVQ